MLQKKTFVVTGATGFIGRALTERLEGQGHKVRRIVRHTPTNDDERRCGLDATVEQWMKILEGCSGVFHLAWSTVPGTANLAPLADIEDNLLGTVRLLEALRQSPKMPFVFASSGGTVYGIPDTVPIAEQHALRPLGVYGATKVCAESYLMAYRRQWNVDGRILRLSNPFGPGQNVKGGLGAATIFAAQAVAGRSIEIWGDGSIIRDYLYIDDVVSGFVAVMETPMEVFCHCDPIINIGSGHGISLLEIVRTIEDLLEKKLSVNFKDARKFDVPTNVLDIDRAKTLLKWAPNTTFRSGMGKMLLDFSTRVDTKIV